MHQISLSISSNPYLPALRHLSLAACCLYFCLAASLSASPGGQEAAEEDELVPARHNPILREYFRRQFSGMRSTGSTRFPGSDRFNDALIDRQIDHYVTELREKLTLLNTHFEEVEREREAIRQAASPQARGQARVSRRRALDGVQDQAGDLWNMLRYIFVALEDKGDSKPVIETTDTGSLFEKEIQFMGEQIGKAEKRITQYFFETERTISLEDLQGENMLIHLYRVREMAKKLRERGG